MVAEARESNVRPSTAKLENDSMVQECASGEPLWSLDFSGEESFGTRFTSVDLYTPLDNQTYASVPVH